MLGISYSGFLFSALQLLTYSSAVTGLATWEVPTLTLPCTTEVITKTGKNGYGNNYHIGNRIHVDWSPPDKTGVSSFAYAPDGMPMVSLLIKKHSILVKGKVEHQVQYWMEIYNDDTKKRSLRLAWNKDKQSKEPFYIFTVDAVSDSKTDACLITGDDPFYLTIQAI